MLPHHLLTDLAVELSTTFITVVSDSPIALGMVSTGSLSP